ncbi:MAG: hypothetical protein AAF628_32680 [Planctomycetota bacterium]
MPTAVRPSSNPSLAAALGRTFGDQTPAPSTLLASGTGAIASALAVGASWGAGFGLALLALGLAGTGHLVRCRGQPCYTVESEGLVQHAGRRCRTIPWGELGGRVRVARVHWQWFLEVRRQGRSRLLAVDGLSVDERAELCGMVRERAVLAGRCEKAPAPARP